MTPWRRRIPFRVDIAGIIEIMGSSLYSRPDTPIRELIQNAHDAVQRRRRRDLSYKGTIHIVQDSDRGTLTFRDDGIGLTAEEAEKYLGTLGIGITGLIKKGITLPDGPSAGGDADLIGQFGIGLFSSFMLGDRLIVESRHLDQSEGVRWEAGAGTDIELSNCERSDPGTSVTVHLKSEHQHLAETTQFLEAAIKEYADFLPVPIVLNQEKVRANVINVAWFDPTPDEEEVELALESYFGETPLEVISLRPVRKKGARNRFRSFAWSFGYTTGFSVPDTFFCPFFCPRSQTPFGNEENEQMSKDEGSASQNWGGLSRQADCRERFYRLV